jgi:hypothetical protein
MKYGLANGVITGKREPQELPDHLLVGNAMHAGLNEWALGRQDNNPSAVRSFNFTLNERWPQFAPQTDIDKFQKLGYGWFADYEIRSLQSVDGDEPWGVIESVEDRIGYRKDDVHLLGNERVAGTPDLTTTHVVVDYKTCGSRSRYRQAHKACLPPIELILYAHLTGKRRGAYVLFVHDLKTPKMEVRTWDITNEHISIVAAVVARVADAVDNDVYLPPADIGKGFPCSAQYCDYYSGVCPIINPVPLDYTLITIAVIAEIFCLSALI